MRRIRKRNPIPPNAYPSRNGNSKFNSLQSNKVIVEAKTINRKSVPKVKPRSFSQIKNSHPLFSKNESHLLSDIMFVAYYTKNTAYEREASKLISSLQKLNVNYDVKGVDSLGSWQANTRFKAKFMQEMLLKHKDMNLVYVDVDAIVHSLPIHFKDYDGDIGIRYQDFKWRKNECLSGTIYMANNSKVMRICKEWEILNSKEANNSKNLEQWNLGDVIEKMKGPLQLKVNNLPPEYTFIFDSMKRIYPGVVPVIEHFQASRKNRNLR